MTARRALGKRRLEALIEEAIVDAYGESEQRVGFLTALRRPEGLHGDGSDNECTRA